MVFKYLGKTKVSCQKLIKDYLPEYVSRRKKSIFEVASEKHKTDDGEISITHVMTNQTEIASAVLETMSFKLVIDEGFYDYTKAREGEDTWFVNFADPTLFVAYDSDLFAQDEIQTLEMPLLASCCLFLDQRQADHTTKTVTDFGEPTPYLFGNVPYWISVNTRPIMKDGTTSNIYGDEFMYATEEELATGIKVFEGNVRVNVLAIAAPRCRSGQRYNTAELAQIIKTLLCSYSAVRDQAEGKVVIHTGNWGCGAFGGNKELMYLAQMYAASVCGIDELVLHAVDEVILEDAGKAFENMDSKMKIADVIGYLHSRKYEWGESDGN